MVGISIFWLVAIVVIILWFMARGKLGSDYIYTEKEMEEQKRRGDNWKTMYLDEKNKKNREHQRELDDFVNHYEETILLLKQSYENKLKKV
jgi:hypothetical protein